VSEPSSDPLAAARAALDRGDYGQVLRLLEPLERCYPPSTAEGGQLQLLRATACLGQGDPVAALVSCRQARRCADASLRQQARELLEVLESPALSRPREWSLTLQQLGAVEPISGRLRRRARRTAAAAPPAPPSPVGPTRPPLGLAVLAALLLLLTLLLGGCVQVRAELHFGAPGRLQLVEQLSPREGQPPGPWQRQFAATLQELGLRPRPAPGQRTGAVRLEGPMQPASATLHTLAASVQQAARLAGVSLPAAELHWRERNWLLGGRQELALELDLRAVAGVPGVELSLDLQPLRPRAVRLSQPVSVQQLPSRRGQGGAVLRWPLRLGERNRLELSCWRWSPLGLGALAIGAALVLVLVLAGLRQRLGFGWPQLPA
jgi:hypothetical protein